MKKGCVLQPNGYTQAIIFRRMQRQVGKQGHGSPVRMIGNHVVKFMGVFKGHIVGHQQTASSEKSAAIGQGPGVVFFLDVDENQVKRILQHAQRFQRITFPDRDLFFQTGSFKVLPGAGSPGAVEFQCEHPTINRFTSPGQIYG